MPGHVFQQMIRWSIRSSNLKRSRSSPGGFDNSPGFRIPVRGNPEQKRVHFLRKYAVRVDVIFPQKTEYRNISGQVFVVPPYRQHGKISECSLIPYKRGDDDVKGIRLHSEIFPC